MDSHTNKDRRSNQDWEEDQVKISHVTGGTDERRMINAYVGFPENKEAT